MKKLFTFCGLPCSGKTYVAKLIANKIFNDNCTFISCGDIARSLMVTPELREQTAKNDLFPLEDELRKSIQKMIDNSSNNVIIMEGFPRFADQANWLIDNLWVYMPEIVNVNVGDYVTLINRAKMRGRESDADFTARLGKAESNMNSVFDVLYKRAVSFYTIHSGNDDYIVNAFRKYFKDRMP